MGISAVIGAIGIGVAAAGTVMTYSSQKKQAEAQQQAIADQQKAEALRQRQMNLDAARKKREMVRQALAARSSSLATVTAQGAAGNGSSALGGAYGSISGRLGVNELGVNQNQEIGNSLFAVNQNMLSAYSASAAAGAGVALGNGLSTLGGALMKNNDTIARVGTTAFTAASNFAKGF